MLWDLWIRFVEAAARACTWAGLRRALILLATFAVALAFIQIAPAEIALLLAGDAVTYLELAALAWLATANGRLREALAQAGRLARAAAARLGRSARTLTASQIRHRLAARRAAAPARPRPPAAHNPDPDGPAWAFATAA